MTGLLAAATSAADKRVAFRAGLSSGRIQRLPGAFNPLVALFAAEAGLREIFAEGTQSGLLDRMPPGSRLNELLQYARYSEFDSDIVDFSLGRNRC